MRGMSYKNIRPIEILHHEWCKKEGRDTSWFERRKEDDLLEPKKTKRTKRKRA
tara:strand:- start:185 stop:343 length:159 start_codon:yes stop_codon:yes gene_type:complete